MAPSYKLTYFDARGAVEAARFLLKYAGIDFEDIRVKTEDWPKEKEIIAPPFGQLPVLEHKGKQVNQSTAITRYLGKVVKLAGNDDWENLEIDAIVDTIVDLRNKVAAGFRETDETKKIALKEVVIKETIPYNFSRLDAIAQKNNGHLALERMTWADFFFVSAVPVFDLFVGGNALEGYQNLKALRDKVEAIPAIKEWIEIRPKTEF